jgi:hypothetical protein
MELPPITTHIFAYIRDESGNLMSMATRIEFCANDECVAVFDSRGYDSTLVEHYFMLGSTFYVFTARKLIQVVKRRFNYENQLPIPEENVDRFDISSWDFCEMIWMLYRDKLNWRCACITKELASWLDQEEVINPVLLNFIVSPIGFRRIY